MKARSPESARASVKLSEARCALLLIDVIHPMEFDGAHALAPRASKAAGYIRSLGMKLRRQGVQNVYVNDNFGDWSSDFDKLVDACRRRGGVSTELADMLAPRSGDITLLKPRYSAFQSTPLRHLLAQMATRELVLAGFATDGCVLMTAADAYQLGFELWVPSDCCAAESEERHVEALRWMQRTLGAKTCPAFKA